MVQSRQMSCLSFGLYILAIIGQVGGLSSAAENSTAHVPLPISAPNLVKELYIIYPGTSIQRKKFKFDLQTLVGADNVKEYGTQFTGVEFWLVNMDINQVKSFSARNPPAVIHRDEVVAERQTLNASNPDAPSINGLGAKMPDLRPTTGIAYEKGAPDDLKVVSWKPGKKAQDLHYYAYDRRGGQDVVMYVVENGIDPRNPEFAFNPTTWLYAPSVKVSQTDDDQVSHGSCVASKAVGTHYGISKGTQLIIVKSALTESDVIWAFANIANDMSRKEGSGRKSVILFAFGSKVKYDPSRHFSPLEPWKRLRDLMQVIIRLDGIIVVPSGNGRNGSYRENTDILPALFARAPMGYLPLTLVGACDNDGILAPFSQQSPYIRAWAPGVDVKCAKSAAVELDSGTSVSTGMVAGLAAYFLGNSSPPFDVGRGTTALNFNNYLRSTASWRRSRGGVPNMIWNLQDGAKILPFLNSTSLDIAVA